MVLIVETETKEFSVIFLLFFQQGGYFPSTADTVYNVFVTVQSIWMTRDWVSIACICNIPTPKYNFTLNRNAGLTSLPNWKVWKFPLPGFKSGI